ncbi:MAG: phosphate signaling complex protein PhoU [Eubacteriales bacterium]
MVVRAGFDKEIENIHEQIIRMGTLTQNAIEDAVTALVEMDIEKAKRVIAQDDVIDAMERQIDQACVELIARQQPVARDLRDTISNLKLITDLERIADHASDISEKVLILDSFHTSVMIPADLIRMSDLSQLMIRSALESYVTKNEETAAQVLHMDDKVDALYDKVKAYLTKRMRQDPDSIELLTEILLVCKYFERISDHAQNVAEWVLFYIRGRRVD